MKPRTPAHRGPLIPALCQLAQASCGIPHAHTAQEHLEDVTVEQVMTALVETADPEGDIATAAHILLENKISRLPVVEGMRLVGILTEADFVRYVAERV